MRTIAIIGAGNMGAVHGAALASLGVPIAAMCDTDPATQEMAERFGARFFQDAATMLDQIRPDLVDICTPTFTHRELAELAASRGAHLLVEKPLARRVVDAEAMLAACQRAGVKLFPGHVTRFYPEFRAVREQVQAGTVGQVQSARLFRQSDRPAAAWMADPALSGGVIIDLMIHDFDWVQWSLGEVEEVFCRATPALDQAHAMLRLASGATVLVEGSWLHPEGFACGAEIQGDAGDLTMECRGQASPLKLFLRGRAPATENPMALSPHARELAHLLAVLKGEAEPEVTAEEGLTALRIAEAALTSALTGRSVLVEEVEGC